MGHLTLVLRSLCLLSGDIWHSSTPTDARNHLCIHEAVS